MPSLRVAVVGAGTAGLEALVALHELAGDRVEATLVAPEEAFSWLPLGVGEPFGLGHPRRHALAEICDELRTTFRRAALVRVEAGARRVLLEPGPPETYDALLLAVGARLRPAYANAITFDRAEAPEAFDGVVHELEAGELDSIAYVVPPGTDWTLPAYELALMSAAWGARARSGGGCG